MLQHQRHKDQIIGILFTINGSPALGNDIHTNLVSLEVSLLYQYLGTVGKHPFHGIKLLVRLLCHHFPGCGKLPDQRFGLYIIHIRSNILGINARHDGRKFGFGRIGNAFFVRH